MNEFLRMMPVPNTFRMCTKDYAVPGTDFTIPKGTKVVIPIVSTGQRSECTYATDSKLLV